MKVEQYNPYIVKASRRWGKFSDNVLCNNERDDEEFHVYKREENYSYGICLRSGREGWIPNDFITIPRVKNAIYGNYFTTRHIKMSSQGLDCEKIDKFFEEATRAYVHNTPLPGECNWRFDFAKNYKQRNFTQKEFKEFIFAEAHLHQREEFPCFTPEETFCLMDMDSDEPSDPMGNKEILYEMIDNTSTDKIVDNLWSDLQSLLYHRRSHAESAHDSESSSSS